MRIVKFETRYEAGKDPVDWAELAPAGESFGSTRTWVRVKDVTPPERLQNATEAQIAEMNDFDARMALRWNIIGPAYEAFKRSEDIPLDGLPLAAWPGVTASQADVLKGMGIRTVQEVVEMGEGATSRLKWPNARKLPQMAASYLEGQDMAAKDAEIAAMQERMEVMEAMLEENVKLTKDGKVDGRTKAARAQKEDAA